MRKRFLLSFLIALGLLVGFFLMRQYENVQKEKALTAQIAENVAVVKLSRTSNDRLMKAVLTLPDGDSLVGLRDGTGTYPYIGGNKKIVTGTVKVGTILASKFIQNNTIGGTARMDVFAPITLSGDSNGGSTYVVLFRDRGDAVIERSYVRLGGATSVVIKSCTILEPDATIPNEEYRLDVTFEVTHGKKNVVKTETIIPVVDGLFSTLGVVTQ